MLEVEYKTSMIIVSKLRSVPFGKFFFMNSFYYVKNYEKLNEMNVFPRVRVSSVF